MKPLSILFCGVLIICSSMHGFTSEKSSVGTNKETQKAEESSFEACGKEDDKGCSKFKEKGLTGKSYNIKKKQKSSKRK